jgi:hypothetical protein
VTKLKKFNPEKTRFKLIPENLKVPTKKEDSTEIQQSSIHPAKSKKEYNNPKVVNKTKKALDFPENGDISTSNIPSLTYCVSGF